MKAVIVLMGKKIVGKIISCAFGGAYPWNQFHKGKMSLYILFKSSGLFQALNTNKVLLSHLFCSVHLSRGCGHGDMPFVSLQTR